jgi:hypothetical protein
MSDLSVQIAGFVEGDNLEIRRTITGLEAGIETAWLTVKREPTQEDDDAVISKAITTTDVPGTGHIETAGGVGVDGVLRFDLMPADTRALGELKWIHDIQIELTSGKIYTVELGTIELTGDVRTTTT